MKGIRSMQVKEVMTSDLITISENALMREVDQIFKDNNFHHLPVLKESSNQLCGIISLVDVALLKDWGTRLNLQASLKTDEKLFSSLLAADVMKKQPVCISPEAIIDECVDLFEENAFHALPVIKNDELVGLITTYDLIRLAYR